MPYASSWTVGIQRDLGGRRALEVRYNGNITRNQWLASNINEVNIFENGFLNEFKNAQKNLNINQAAGVTSFANRGLPGQVDLPILTATGIAVNNAAAVNELAERPGRHPGEHAGDQPRFLLPDGGHVVRAVRHQLRRGRGLSDQLLAGQPIRHRRIATYMDDVRLLQLQRSAGGVPPAPVARHDVNANYTLSKTYGVAARADYTANYTQFTLRDPFSS